MTLKALFIRADGAFAEIEDVRRQAFVAAFREAGFDWDIDRNAFAASCQQGGLMARMTYFVHRNLKRCYDTPDVESLSLALHRKATKVFSTLVAKGRLEPRAGIRELCVSAHREGIRLGLVTALCRRDVEAMLRHALGDRGVDLFDTMVFAEEDQVSQSPDILYAKLKSEAGVDPDACLVIEATLGGTLAAKAAGFATICTRSAFCSESPGSVDSAGFFEDLPSILARSSERRGEPLSFDEREDLFAAFQKMHCGNFDKDQTSRGHTMRVSDILKIKGSAVKTVEPTASIRSFCKALRSEGVGAMVVKDKAGQICGIITERDLARGIIEFGNDLSNMTVASLMTTDIVTCSPDDSIASIAKVMTHRRIRHLPVVVGSTISGLVSIGDVLKYRLDEVQMEASILRDFAIARR